jgi:hypothetical protein
VGKFRSAAKVNAGASQTFFFVFSAVSPPCSGRRPCPSVWDSGAHMAFGTTNVQNP